MEHTLRTFETFVLEQSHENVDTLKVNELLKQFNDALAKCERNITEHDERTVLRRRKGPRQLPDISACRLC